MKKTVKILALILAVVAVMFAFAGCGDKKVDEPKSDLDSSNVADAGKTYIIYSDNGFAPFEYLDTATGEYVGLDMDLFAAIAEDQGIKYEMKNEGFDASMGAVQAGQADAMIAGMTISEKRAETFDFSDGYFDDGQILVVKSDSSIAKLEDLKGKTVAIKASTKGAEYAESVKDEYGFSTVVYEGSAEMYQAVSNGINDACFEDFSVIGWAIKEEGIALKTVGDVVNPGSYGFAVKKGTNAELIEKFNAGLANIKASGKYEEIRAKYGY